MPDPTHLYDIALYMQQAIIDCYADNSIALPSRHVITEGQSPAHDCEQFSITLINNISGVGGQNTTPCYNVREANYNIAIVRCASSPQDNGSPPSPTTIAGFSEVIYTDAYLLPKCLTELMDCKVLQVNALQTLEPSGGLGGVILGVSWVLGEEVVIGS